MKNKIISILIMVTLVFTTSTLSYATTSDSEDELDYSASEVMSYEELIQYHADKYDISYEEAEAEVNPNGQMPQTQSSTRSTYTGYRVLKITLNVTSSYKPKLELYVETDNWNSYWIINNIYYITMVRSYNGISKQFQGDIKCWNRGNNKVEYTVNGDFYNNGTTSAGVDVSIGVGESATASFSVSSSRNHYKYFYVHETKQWAGN